MRRSIIDETSSSRCEPDDKRPQTKELDDQGKAREFSGQKVIVVGSYDKTSQTIHVNKMQAQSWNFLLRSEPPSC